jgi:hypothetical protein
MSVGNRKKGDKLTSEGIRIDGIYKGFPYEGPVLNLKNDDPEHMKPRLVATVTVDTFLMDNKEDVKKYKAHMEDVGRGWAQVSLEDVQWIPSPHGGRWPWMGTGFLRGCPMDTIKRDLEDIFKINASKIHRTGG